MNAKVYPYQVWTVTIPKRSRARVIALLRKCGWAIDRETAQQLRSEAFVVNWFRILGANDAADRGEVVAAIEEAMGREVPRR